MWQIAFPLPSFSPSSFLMPERRYTLSSTHTHRYRHTHNRNRLAFICLAFLVPPFLSPLFQESQSEKMKRVLLLLTTLMVATQTQAFFLPSLKPLSRTLKAKASVVEVSQEGDNVCMCVCVCGFLMEALNTTHQLPP